MDPKSIFSRGYQQNTITLMVTHRRRASEWTLSPLKPVLNLKLGDAELRQEDWWDHCWLVHALCPRAPRVCIGMGDKATLLLSWPQSLYVSRLYEGGSSDCVNRQSLSTPKRPPPCINGILCCDSFQSDRYLLEGSSYLRQGSCKHDPSEMRTNEKGLWFYNKHSSVGFNDRMHRFFPNKSMSSTYLNKQIFSL